MRNKIYYDYRSSASSFFFFCIFFHGTTQKVLKCVTLSRARSHTQVHSPRPGVNSSSRYHRNWTAAHTQCDTETCSLSFTQRAFCVRPFRDKNDWRAKRRQNIRQRQWKKLCFPHFILKQLSQSFLSRSYSAGPDVAKMTTRVFAWVWPVWLRPTMHELYDDDTLLWHIGTLYVAPSQFPFDPRSHRQPTPSISRQFQRSPTAKKIDFANSTK